MSIGRGWHPNEEPEEEHKILAKSLLKDKLSEIFALAKQRKEEGKECHIRCTERMLYKIYSGCN